MNNQEKTIRKFFYIFLTSLLALGAIIVTLILVTLSSDWKIFGFLVTALIYLGFIFWLIPKIEVENMIISFQRLVKNPNQPFKNNKQYFNNTWNNEILKQNYLRFQNDVEISSFYRFQKQRNTSVLKRSSIDILILVNNESLDFHSKKINAVISKLEDDFFKKEKFKSYSIIIASKVKTITSENILKANNVLFLKKNKQHMTQINVLISDKEIYFLENNKFYPNFHYHDLCNEVRTVLLLNNKTPTDNKKE